MTQEALITIQSYSIQWPIAYNQLRTIYERNLEGLYDDIQHVGSTSVEGLASKPIVDIDIIIVEESSLPEIVNRLEGLGYRYLGTMGIPGRHAFAAASAADLNIAPRDWINHNLYVCTKGSLALKNHVHFRDYLRANPQSVEEYGALKRQLAATAPTIDWYVAQKTAFITEILLKCGLDNLEIEKIRDVNKSNDVE